jgi:hypothetical protein
VVLAWFTLGKVGWIFGAFVANNPVGYELSLFGIGALTHLITTCAGDAVIGSVQFSLKIDDENRIRRIFPSVSELTECIFAVLLGCSTITLFLQGRCKRIQ